MEGYLLAGLAVGKVFSLVEGVVVCLEARKFYLINCKCKFLPGPWAPDLLILVPLLQLASVSYQMQPPFCLSVLPYKLIMLSFIDANKHLAFTF